MPTGIGTAAIIGSGLLSAGASIYGAKQQNKTNQQNLSAQEQARSQLQGLIMPQLSSGTNPYAQQMMDFLGNMQGYQNPGAFTATPSTIDLSSIQQATAPTGQAGGLIDLSSLGVSAPGAVNAQQINASGTGAPSQITPEQISGGLIDPSVTQSQAFNTGQDGLLQMMQRNLMPTMDQGLTSQLNQYASGDSRFDTSGLLDALRPIDERMVNDQASELRGSAGSLGQRLGSSMMDQERQLRGNFLDQTSARNAGIQQQSYEAAQARAMQALGLSTGREQAFGQMGLQAAGQQSQVAQMLAQLGLGQSGLAAQIAQANAGNQLQASQGNAANSLAAQQANAANQLNSGQFNAAQQFAASQGNAANALNAGQFSAQQQLQAQLANQQTNLSGQQSNSDIINRIMMANQQAQLQASLANSGQYNQALEQNASFLNQGNQFNAQQQMMQNQFGANQQNLFNQLMMTGFGQANQMQQGDRGLNAQLLGLLAGVPVPQAQPSAMPQAISDAGGMAMLLPFLMQMNQQTRSPVAAPAPAPVPTTGYGLPFNF